MKQITDELYKKLEVGSILRTDAFLKNTDVSNHSPKYWLNQLRHARWRVDQEEKNYIDVLLLYAKSIKITQKDIVVVACGCINAKRKTSSKTKSGKNLKEIHIELNDLDYDVKEDNCEEWFEKLEKAYNGVECIIETNPQEYDVSTLNIDKLPDCKTCDGNGFLTCEDCAGEGATICEQCEGIGEISYEAGNFAHGSTRYKSKHCANCSGSGKLKCPTCQGTGKITCPSCKGSGKSIKGDDAHVVKTYKDVYTLDKEVSFCMLTDEGNVNIIHSDYSGSIINKEWFSPFHILQFCHYHNKGNKLVMDYSHDIIQEIGEENREYIKILEHFLPSQERQKDMVCFIENGYLLRGLTAIEITHNINGEDEEEVLYLYKGNLWFDAGVGYLSNTEKIGKVIKYKIKSIFGK